MLCGIEAAELLQISSGATSQIKKSADYLGIDLSGIDQITPPSALEPFAPVQAPVPSTIVRGGS